MPALGQVLLAFEGLTLPPAMRERLAATPTAGITLFRHMNVGSAVQVRALTDEVQRVGGRDGPLLIAADQEGGQFLALGDDTTPFAGNMALGAAGDPGLTERVAAAMGREMRALGVNLVYGPCADVASNPANPGIGIRSFGSEPGAVSAHTAAWVRGMQSAGVAAAAKHFPGLGEAALDSHEGLPVLDADRARLDAIELAPFRAAIEAGAAAVMSAHVAVPSLTGDMTLPATLARAVMTDLLRAELGFEGLTITDALDMRALPQGPEQALDAIAAIGAGVDLLLLTADEVARERIETALRHAEARGLLEPAALAATAERLARLRGWLGSVPAPDPAIVGSAAHLQLARELAERSVTLVRNEDALLPLRLAPDARILAIMPRPRDLTPADTSSGVAPELAAALRAQHACVEEVVVGHPPSSAEIAAARDRAAASDLVVVGTIAASFDPPQLDLVTALQATRVPTITVALRTPFDLAAYPSARTHVCTYGILRPSLDALAAAVFGREPFAGRLPAPIPGLAPAGYGLAA